MCFKRVDKLQFQNIHICTYIYIYIYISEWGVSTHVVFFSWARWEWGLATVQCLSSSSDHCGLPTAPRPKKMHKYMKYTNIHFFICGCVPGGSPCGPCGGAEILVNSKESSSFHIFTKHVSFCGTLSSWKLVHT